MREVPRIGCRTSVASSAIIGPDVVVGDDCTIGAYCIVEGRVTIGDRSVLGPACTVGTRSRQSWRQGDSGAGRVEIGTDVLLLDHVMVNAPLGELTRLGDRASIGAFGAVGHDGDVGADVIVAPHCALGGYVCLGDWSNLGLGVRIHPRLVVGAFAMCGMGAVVTKHVAPGITVRGVPARMDTVNAIGLVRAGLAVADRDEWVAALRTGRPPRPGGTLAAHVAAFHRQVARWGRLRPVLPDLPWLAA